MLQRSKSRILEIGAVLLIMTLIACGGSTSLPNLEKGIENQVQDLATTVNGTTISITDFDGKPTVLWFWSPN